MRVYIADSIPDAHLVSNLLSSHRIANKVINENLAGTMGEVPPTMDTSPAVCLLKKEEYSLAMKVLTENIKGFKEPKEYQSIVDVAAAGARKNPAALIAAVIVITLVILIIQAAAS
ncbi:MAG: hypothetical protein ACYTFG_05850 [Planctomycetota bacterium]